MELINSALFLIRETGEDTLKLIVLDTNILLHSDFQLGEVKEKIIIPITVVEELDGLKKGKGDLAFRARRAIRELRKNDNVEYVFEDYSHLLPKDWDHTKADNKILGTAIYKQCPVLTNDFNLQIKAKAVGLEVKEFKVDFKQPVGYKELFLDMNIREDALTLEHIYQNPEDNIYDLVGNEYLIIYQKRDLLLPSERREVIDTFRWDKEKQELVRLKIKQVNNGITGKAKARNVHQSILFDIMQNDEIPIKLALGKFGVGKVFAP